MSRFWFFFLHLSEFIVFLVKVGQLNPCSVTGSAKRACSAFTRYLRSTGLSGYPISGSSDCSLVDMWDLGTITSMSFCRPCLSVCAWFRESCLPLHHLLVSSLGSCHVSDSLPESVGPWVPPVTWATNGNVPIVELESTWDIFALLHGIQLDGLL